MASWSSEGNRAFSTPRAYLPWHAMPCHVETAKDKKRQTKIERMSLGEAPTKVAISNQRFMIDAIDRTGLTLRRPIRELGCSENRLDERRLFLSPQSTEQTNRTGDSIHRARTRSELWDVCLLKPHQEKKVSLGIFVSQKTSHVCT